MQVVCGVPAAITIDAAEGLRRACARSESRELDAPPPECPQPAGVIFLLRGGRSTPRQESPLPERPNGDWRSAL